METTINIKIDNMIRGYCSNFLSYLYTSNGWKRIMLGTSKENYRNDNRIVITNTGTIILTCQSSFDFIDCLEFIREEFEYGRMGYYLVYDDDTIMKTNYVTKIKLKDFYYGENNKLVYDYGSIKFDKCIAILKYENIEDGERMIEIIQEIYFQEESKDSKNEYIKESEESGDREENEDFFNVVIAEPTDMFIEKIMYSTIILWGGIKMLEFL